MLYVLLRRMYTELGKNMELKELIREYQEKTGCSDSELARRTGVTRSTVTRWRSGEIRKASSDTLEQLSMLMGYNIEPLLQGKEISIFLPVLGYVKAGYNLFAQENHLGEEEVSLQERRQGDYYLKVSGDSMKGDGIMNGSLVLVQQCSEVESGTIAVVMIGSEVTVKKVIYKNKMMILEAANPDVQNRYYTAQEVKELPVSVIGRVVSCKTVF